MVVVESAGMTDVGCKRTGNEDSLLISDDMKLYVVADGMGGHQAGEVASRVVIETMKSYMERFMDGAHVEELNDTDSVLTREANRMLASIRLANRSVYSISQAKDACRGMGSTVSAVWFTQDSFVAANVGDSPIYLIQGDSIEVLSVPHTVLAEQASMAGNDKFKIDEKYRHMLTRGMGVSETVDADICENQCYKGNTFVICSDGLSDKVLPDEILDVVKGEKPDRACSRLIDMAKERGGEDNITVIIVRVKKVKQSTRRGFFSSLLKKMGI
ncbi:MAG: protein phosphatase 2C domain-containing protein [Proteobacteria bacterium]|nr:protein phosphatase 2C domain-containing protein [Pseudomonadota bacterium]